MESYITKVSLNDHSTIDPKSTERYVIRDASLSLVPHPSIENALPTEKTADKAKQYI